MDDIGALSASCLRCFVKLIQSLPTSSDEFTKMMPPSAINKEYARFKIWAGNLGALQRGRSSLDARLRDSVVLRGAVLKFLGQLQETLTKSAEITTGVRLPYDQTLPTDLRSSDEDAPLYDDEDIGSISDTSGELDTGELTERLREIEDVMEHLYRLSFKIRNTRYRSLAPKALLLKDEDEETGKDLFSAYAIFDRRHVKAVLDFLRLPPPPQKFETEHAQVVDHDIVDLLDTDYHLTDSDDFLLNRLAKAITNRRRYFEYWQKHALKLSQKVDEPAFRGMVSNSTSLVKPLEPASKPDVIVPTADNLIRLNGSKTVVSGTDFSRYNNNLDDQLDTESVISYATTAFDLDGKSPEFPLPPTDAAEKSEEHIRQDLQPYVCTYEECPDADRMYASRHAWLEHERLFHRRVWKCFEHRSFISKSRESLFQHFSSCHQGLDAQEIENLLDLAETTLDDDRKSCPFCHSNGPFKKGFHNHIAFHQEQLATFAVPRNLNNDENSRQAQGSRSSDSLFSTALDFLEKNGSSESADDGVEPKRYEKRLIDAAKSGDVVLLEGFLNDPGVDVNGSDTNGQSALSYAAENGHEEIVKILLGTGDVEVDSKDDAGITPLSYAAENGHEEIVKMLLDTGRVAVSSRCNDGKTPLHLAAKSGNEATVKLLLASGQADANLQDHNGKTPLHIAAGEGHQAVVKLLLASGKVDANCQDKKGETPLYEAAWENSNTVVKLLLEAGVDVNAHGGAYGNSLQAASRSGDSSTVRMLLEAGADVNAQGGYYGNALQAASSHGPLTIIRILLDAGADVNAQGGHYGSALSAALKEGNWHIAEMLREAGAREEQAPSTTAD
ncbi:hypothetical protein AYO22_09344 [Fonsecaea multimorphosa]|nr:hypothetical protein AYO22_09344 [Fonsecaea multimorphosa]